MECGGDRSFAMLQRSFPKCCYELHWNPISCDMKRAYCGDELRGVVENWVENEELRKHEERRDIYWEKKIDIEHYASRKHLSWELLDLFCECCCCNLVFFISEHSNPQDTHIKSIILGIYEQCFRNKCIFACNCIKFKIRIESCLGMYVAFTFSSVATRIAYYKESAY